MQLRYNYRVYPTPGQQIELARAFGCARVVFNDGLRARQDARVGGLPYISDGELSKRVITEAKKTEARAWLGKVSAVVLQQALADLNVAYRNFFASVTGKRKGRRRPGTGARSPASTGTPRQPGSARILARGPGSTCRTGGGTARAGSVTTGTWPPHRSSWPWDARTSQTTVERGSDHQRWWHRAAKR